jgi:competence protein ComK
MKYEYIINAETIMILPDYNENGFLHALLCKGGQYTKVDISPYNLIDINLRYRGSSLRGAMDGSLEVFESGKMNPIVLDKEQGLIFFPSTALTREDCVWFNLKHIVDFTAIDKKRTRVNLSNGSAITINISKWTFGKKLNKAYELQYKMQERTKGLEDPEAKLQNPYHLFVKEDGVNYEDDLFQA